MYSHLQEIPAISCYSSHIQPFSIISSNFEANLAIIPSWTKSIIPSFYLPFVQWFHHSVCPYSNHYISVFIANPSRNVILLDIPNCKLWQHLLSTTHYYIASIWRWPDKEKKKKNYFKGMIIAIDLNILNTFWNFYSFRKTIFEERCLDFLLVLLIRENV